MNVNGPQEGNKTSSSPSHLRAPSTLPSIHPSITWKQRRNGPWTLDRHSCQAPLAFAAVRARFWTVRGGVDHHENCRYACTCHTCKNLSCHTRTFTAVEQSFSTSVSNVKCYLGPSTHLSSLLIRLFVMLLITHASKLSVGHKP